MSKPASERVEEIVPTDVKISCILSIGEFSHTLEYEFTTFFSVSQNTSLFRSHKAKAQK